MEDTKIQIEDIFKKNEVQDLQNFLKRLDSLNQWNSALSYIFHASQSAGILVTTISAGYNNTNLIWLGVTLNAMASLLHIYEKNNNEIIIKLSEEIKAIKDGNYVNQRVLVDDDDDDDIRSLNLNNLANNTTVQHQHATI